MRYVLALPLLASALLIACSSSSKNNVPATRAPAQSAAPTLAATAGASRSTPTPASGAHGNEDGIAKAALLTANDFPAGWTESPRDSSQNPLSQCDPGRPPSETGRAESGEFSQDGTASTTETVGLFDTPQQVQASLTQIPALGDCVVKAVKGGALDTSEYSVTDASFEPLSFASLGDQSQAYRAKLMIKLKNQSGPASQATAYIDLLYVLSGRGGFQLEASNVEMPFDASRLQDVANKALAKLRQNLPAR
jgi:hypothetical protein